MAFANGKNGNPVPQCKECGQRGWHKMDCSKNRSES